MKIVYCKQELNHIPGPENAPSAYHDHIKPRVAAPLVFCKVIFRRPAQPNPLVRANRGKTALYGRAAFYFHKDQQFAAARDDVNFRAAGSAARDMPRFHN